MIIIIIIMQCDHSNPCVKSWYCDFFLLTSAFRIIICDYYVEFE